MTEFEEKQEALAQFLLELYYGKGAWDLPDYRGLRENYRADAIGTLLSNPHLLSAAERVRMWREEYELVYLSLSHVEDVAKHTLDRWERFYNEMKEVVE